MQSPAQRASTSIPTLITSYPLLVNQTDTTHHGRSGRDCSGAVSSLHSHHTARLTRALWPTVEKEESRNRSAQPRKSLPRVPEKALNGAGVLYPALSACLTDSLDVPEDRRDRGEPIGSGKGASDGLPVDM